MPVSNGTAQYLLETIEVEGALFDESVRQINQLCDSRESLIVFLDNGILNVVSGELGRKLIENKDVAEIKAALTTLREYSFEFAFERNFFKEAVDLFFVYVKVMPLESGKLLKINDPDTLFYKHNPNDIRVLNACLEIIFNLIDAQSAVLQEFSSYNVIPRLLFLIEKIHTASADPKEKPLLESIRIKAIMILRLILTLDHVKNLVSENLNNFNWYLRIFKNSRNSSYESELALTLAELTISEEFLLREENSFIVEQWAYSGILKVLGAKILKPEDLDLLYSCSKVLTTVTTSLTGVKQVIDLLEQKEFLWKLMYKLLMNKTTPKRNWVVLFNLANNLLRYPYYSPPSYSLEVFAEMFYLFAKRNRVLLIPLTRIARYFTFEHNQRLALGKTACEV